MRVHFQNTLDDYRDLLRAFPLRRRLEWTLAFPLWLVASSLPGTALLVFLGDWYALAVGWALLLAFIGWFFLNVRRAWHTLDPKALAPASVWFDGNSVTSESGYGWSRRDWTMIREVRETGTHILLFTTEAEAFAIPRRAFASTAEADEFATAAHRAFQRSREPDYVPYSPPLPAEAVVERPAGVISALQVRYQNTAEELATIQFRGLVNPDPFSKRIVAWLWLAVLGGFVVWLAAQRGPEQQPWQLGQIGSVLIFGWLLVVGIQSWQSLQAWRARRRTDPHRLLPQVLTIAASGISGQAEIYEHSHYWSVVDEVAENDRFVVLFITKPRFLAVIPKSALASRLEVDQFVQLARYWKQAAGEATTRDLAPAVISDNPYQSPSEQ